MSSFGWIDHSEKQRRQVMEAIDLFREKDTRDELGLASIRDAISDRFFPGTSQLQTRARYFFFVPWIVQRYESANITAAELAKRVRDVEIGLIETLLASGAFEGVIGRVARSALVRTPSSIYWNGLKSLKFIAASGSIVDYYRVVTQPAPKVARQTRNDDGEAIVPRASAWHQGIPAAPRSFHGQASIELTKNEAQFLKEQVLTHHPSSLFAFFLNRGVADSDVDFAWNHPDTRTLPPALATEVRMARTFSEVMHGAAILYNRALGEMEPRRQNYIDNCQEALDQWRANIDQRQHDVEQFSDGEFWTFLANCGHSASMQTRVFVDAWFRVAVDQSRRKNLESDQRAIDLVFARERQMKGPMARCESRRQREIWEGAAGMGQLGFRWQNAETLLNDIAEAEAKKADA
jgi:hypothetical protein